MTACPFCSRTDGQVKAGFRDGVQRYKCSQCSRRYVPEPLRQGFPVELRQQAVALYTSGQKISQISTQLGLNARTIRNWVHAASAASPAAPQHPPDSHTVPSASPKSTTVLETSAQPETAAKRRATIVEVADLAGVSVSTISNFLNDKGRMSEATRIRIRSAMADLRFTPNSLVKAIRRGRTHIIGVVSYGLLDLANTHNGMITNILSGINAGADSRNYNVLLYTGWPHRMRSTAGLDFLDGHIDGIAWVGPANSEPSLEYAAEAGLPAMMLLSRQTIAGVGYVDTDNVGGMLQIVAHLADLGHRRIAYAGPTHARDFLDRLEGFKDGLRIAGLPCDPDLVVANEAISINWHGTNYTPEYDAALDHWLALPEPPTAIVLSTDAWAEWMAGAIAKRGLRVPEDIAVTGFDNALEDDPQKLGITSVAQDFLEIGRLGGIGLADLIEGASAESCRTILPAKLIVRGSTVNTTRR